METAGDIAKFILDSYDTTEVYSEFGKELLNKAKQAETSKILEEADTL